MSRLNSKISIAVVVVSALALSSTILLLLRRHAEALPRRNADTTVYSDIYRAPRQIATLKDPAVKESSGIVASRSNPGLYWTHNDSGDGPFLYCFDEHGESHGVWKLDSVKARDWEAIAAGPGPDPTKTYLYIGDIGDNGERRSEILVHRIPEPKVMPGDEQSSKRKPVLITGQETLHLRYPDGPHNAEALLAHPRNGNLYIVTKQVLGNPRIYEAPAPLAFDSDATTLRSLGELNLPSMFGGMITDGAISPDGTKVILCDYLRGYELTQKSSTLDFNAIWKQPIAAVDLGSRKQGEAITYRLDSRALLATSEGYPAPLLEIVRR